MEDTGLLTAYVALGLGAVVPIYFGAMGALKYEKTTGKRRAGSKSRKGDFSESEEEEEEEEQAESLSFQDAMMFPLLGSCTLFGLYLLFKFFSQEYINYLLTAYFALLGSAAMTKAFTSIAHLLLGEERAKAAAWNQRFRFKLWKKVKEGKEAVVAATFDYVTVGAVILSVFFTAYYVVTKNWIASNLFGEAFATSAIQLLDLDDFKTGMLLLSGLFFYDVFWVFGTDVMVTVARNFDAPVKILFPKDIWAEKLSFTMLGLGDIVIPGIFIALCLRFDQSLSKDKRRFSRPYFTACMIAYVLGLATTMFVMHTFKAAQPALLYLSPACILSVLLVAVARGELGKVFAYQSANHSSKREAAATPASAKKTK